MEIDSSWGSQVMEMQMWRLPPGSWRADLYFCFTDMKRLKCPDLQIGRLRNKEMAWLAWEYPADNSWHKQNGFIFLNTFNLKLNCEHFFNFRNIFLWSDTCNKWLCVFIWGGGPKLYCSFSTAVLKIWDVHCEWMWKFKQSIIFLYTYMCISLLCFSM